MRYQTNRPFYRGFSQWAEALINNAVRAKRAEQKEEALSDFSAIAHPVPEVFPHFKSRALVWLNTFAPGVCDRVVKRFGRKPIRPAGTHD